MGPLGTQEMIFIFVLALLIFGPKKLPELGKTMAKAISEFRRASTELKSTWDREMTALERETESLNKVTQEVHSDISNSTGYSDDSYYYESGGYGSDSSNSNATDSSTISASATQGAEATTAETASAEGQAEAGAPEPVATTVTAEAVAAEDASSGAVASETTHVSESKAVAS